MLRAFVLFFIFLFYRYFFFAWFPVSSQRCFSFLSLHLMFFLISLIHSCFFLIPAFFPHLKDIFLFFSLCLFFLLLHTVDTSAVFFLYGWLPFSDHSTFTPDFLSHLTNILPSFSYLYFSFSSHRSFPVFPNTLLPPKEDFQNLFLYLTFYLLLWIYDTTKFLHI
jgi:hypothetical protein